jgi:hypothetical protein
MSGDTREVALARPSSVAVHDDGDVFWEPRWIKPQVYLGLFCVQSGRNCCLQVNPFRFRN